MFVGHAVHVSTIGSAIPRVLLLLYSYAWYLLKRPRPLPVSASFQYLHSVVGSNFNALTRSFKMFLASSGHDDY